MKTSCAGAIRGLWDELNQGLFPWIDDNIGELDARHRLFRTVCEAVIRPREFEYAKWKGNGRPPASRLKIFKAFLLKAVLNVKDTKELVRMLRAEPLSRRLCGWDSPGLVPSETRFCCVFGEFAERGFTDEWFAEMIVKHHGDIPAETVSYDSAPVEVRTRTAEANMAELPVECEWGCKRDSQGKRMQWKGGKIHAAVTRDGVPIAVKYTSASLHDSQVMVPLARQASERVPHLFDLADAAYDAEPIRAACAELGTVAVIDANPRRSAEAQQVPGRTVDGFQGQIREHRPSDGPLDSAPDINGIPLEEAFSSSPLPPPSIVHIGLPVICGLQQAADRFSEQWRNTNSSPFQDPDTCPDIYVSYLESFLFGRAYGTI